MFTGIITDIGTVIGVTKQGDTKFKIATNYVVGDMDVGASIAHAGICLTIIDKGTDKQGNWFAVQASNETLSVTTAGDWAVGTKLNLERALKLGDELGGHMVAGHVDGVAKIIDITPEGDSHSMRFEAPADLVKFIAPKGAITLDGTSLTVNQVQGREFTVNIIPHSWKVTTWAQAQIGQHVNLEIDLLARYVLHQMERAAEDSRNG